MIIETLGVHFDDFEIPRYAIVGEHHTHIRLDTRLPAHDDAVNPVTLQLIGVHRIRTTARVDCGPSGRMCRPRCRRDPVHVLYGARVLLNSDPVPQIT